MLFWPQQSWIQMLWPSVSQPVSKIVKDSLLTHWISAVVTLNHKDRQLCLLQRHNFAHFTNTQLFHGLYKAMLTVKLGRKILGEHKI